MTMSSSPLSSTPDTSKKSLSDKFTARRRDRGSSGPQVLSLSTLQNSAISSARSMNPFSGKPYTPVFDLRVPDHRVLDRLVAKDPESHKLSIDPRTNNEAYKKLRARVRKEEYERWAKKFRQLVLDKARGFATAAEEEHHINIKTRGRRTLEENAEIREGYYLDLMRPLIVEYLKAYNVVGKDERLRASESRRLALQEILDNFSHVPNHLGDIQRLSSFSPPLSHSIRRKPLPENSLARPL